MNIFYHCKAVSAVHYSYHANSKHCSTWEILLYEGNNLEWLEVHKAQLIDFLHENINCPKMQDIIIR